jgi:hypothetical protein
MSDAVEGKEAYIFGAGTISCGEWSKYRASKDGPNSFQVQAWVDGFLSGWNVGSDTDRDFLINQHNQVALYAWIDNYCAAHPLDSVVQASFHLRRELLKR